MEILFFKKISYFKITISPIILDTYFFFLKKKDPSIYLGVGRSVRFRPISLIS